MSKIFCLFAFVLAFSLTNASAQSQEYPYTLAVPNGHPTKATSGSDVLKGVFVLKNGTEVKWNILYNKKEKKTVFISFQRPDNISHEVFSGGIQAMTGSQFFNGVILCYGSETPVLLMNCVSNLMVQAGQDCANLGGVHCWMNE